MTDLCVAQDVCRAGATGGDERTPTSHLDDAGRELGSSGTGRALNAWYVSRHKMKNTGTLFELIQRLDECEDSDRSYPLVIYAQNGADAERNSPALVCPRSEGGGPECPLDPTLSEVLGVEQAREAIRVWSAWRGGLTPSPGDRFNAVMFFSRHGAFIPFETDREGM